jgi:5-oxopent-3-ene-1,2,5-tricarboxylate decarboxylase/2-hydroxyhepta-2,4-diene-1,7-dioate isomerase
MVASEDVDVAHLVVRTFVDGDKKQEAPVSEMMFSVAVIISYVSAFMTLEPGDLIATGTPPGVGSLLPGSRVRIEIEPIGALENTVVRA